MEDKLKVLSPGFVIFVKSITLRDQLDLCIVGTMEKESVTPSAWQVHEMFNNRQRPLVTKEAERYIDCESGKRNEAWQELQELSKHVIEQNTYTPEGLANLVLLLHGVGFIPDDEIYEIIKVLAFKPDKEMYRKIVLAFIAAFNNEFIIIGDGEGQHSFDAFEKIRLKLQYVDHYENAVHIIGWLIDWRGAELSIPEVLMAMRPDPKIAMMEFRPRLHVTSKALLSFLTKYPQEAVFWSFLLTDMVLQRPEYCTSELLNFLVRVSWNETGRHLLRKVFSTRTPIRMEESIKKDLAAALKEFLRPQFFSESESNQVLSQADIPNEILPIGGWLSSLPGDEIDAAMNPSTIEAFSKLYLGYLKKVNSDFPSYINGEKDIYHTWFGDVYDAKAQYATHFILTSILRSPELLWQQLLVAYENLLHEIKVHYYGASTSVHCSLQLSSHLLCVLLMHPDVKQVKLNLDRLKTMWEQFTDLVGFSWICYVEREKIISDIENYKHKLKNIELSYILQAIKDSPDDYKPFSTILVEAIRRYATMPWPV